MTMRLPPRFLFMEVNKRCNLRCTHCDFWLRDDDARHNYMPPYRRREVIQEFAELSPDGSLVICGGESMLDLDDYFDMCSTARAAGLRVLSVVNGTRIRTREMADRMVREGPHEISVSLNSHRAELHDRTRGVPGAFDKAVAAVRLLAEARDRAPELQSRIVVMGLIFRSNHTEIEDFYDFVLNDLKADTLKLNFVQPSFGRGGIEDAFFRDEGEVDPETLLAGIDAAEMRFGIDFNPAWREAVKMYFETLSEVSDRGKGWGSASGTRDHICNSYDRNIMVDLQGDARLCYSSQFRGKQLAKRGDLTAFWTTAEDIRAKMRKCNQFCGISHSVRRESSTLAGNAKAEAFRARAEDRAGDRAGERATATTSPLLARLHKARLRLAIPGSEPG